VCIVNTPAKRPLRAFEIVVGEGMRPQQNVAEMPLWFPWIQFEEGFRMFDSAWARKLDRLPYKDSAQMLIGGRM